jgi:Asp-tRNA(Asn)/Glu-tRNA(Gln) amidotransferase A subunit family amidase
MPASTIDHIRDAIAERKTTATALAQNFYARIRQEDPEIGAFLTLCEERALAQAGRIDPPPVRKFSTILFRPMTARPWLVWKRRAR